jgi:hypothetical protein
LLAFYNFFVSLFLGRVNVLAINASKIDGSKKLGAALSSPLNAIDELLMHNF